MKNRFKVFSLCIMAGVIASFVSTGSVLAEPKPVRVEPVEKCYHFVAEEDACGHKSSTWLIKWTTAGDPCAVEVYAAYDNTPELDCVTVKKHKLKKRNLVDFGLYDFEHKKTRKITNFPLANAECNEIWVRTVGEDECNGRWVIINGWIFYLP